MFASKLRAGVALVGAALLGAVGVTTVGVGPDGPGRGAVAAEPGGGRPTPTDALVRQLGDPVYARREAAEGQLRELGSKALPAVRAGAASKDAEVARRCELLLDRIRLDIMDKFAAAFLADKDRRGHFEHPVWTWFVSLAGDSRASRDLFAEVIADPRRAKLLDLAEAVPDRRARLYREEASRQSCNAHYVVAHETIGGNRFMEDGPKASDLNPPPEPVTSASLAAYFMLGSYPETAVTVPGKDRAGRPVREALVVETWAFDKAAGANRPVTRRLFAAWVDRRVDAGALESAYWRATSSQVAEAVPAARRLLTENQAASPAQAQAAVYLSRCGDRTDLARVAHLLDDATVVREVLYDKPAPVQVRDAALAACLTLRGANLADFGFDIIRVRRDPKADAFDMAWLGFWSDESRRAAHKKGRAWLDAAAGSNGPPAPQGRQ